MIIFVSSPQQARQSMRRTAHGIALGAAFAALGIGLMSGCASPGPARAPSLKLPEIASGLTAARVGDEVRLQWTTPLRTTDKLLISGPIEAEICREMPVVAPAAARLPSKPCAPVVLREPVTSGVSEAVDRLPPELTSGSPRLLAYRVQLRNVVGRTAGATETVYAAAGAVPHTVEHLHAKAAKAGVIIEWLAQSGDAVELSRVETVAGVGKPLAETRLRVDVDAEKDKGGTVDRTALRGQTYRYTAQRVRIVELAGQRLELRSSPSTEVQVERTGGFPPEPPLGLVAAPGFADDNASAQDASSALVIDLSWEPDLEPQVAGYHVYRRALDDASATAWQRLDAQPVPQAAYRDRTVVAGRRYRYQVTAVNASGNESPPSREVVETAPAR
jgi:hypothetical protein